MEEIYFLGMEEGEARADPEAVVRKLAINRGTSGRPAIETLIIKVSDSKKKIDTRLRANTSSKRPLNPIQGNNYTMYSFSASRG